MLSSTKPPKCKHCGIRTDALKHILHPDCIEPWLADHRKKQAAKQRKEQMARAKVERAAFKARKQAAKRPTEAKADAQDVFNKYIRARDEDQPCVSCGVENPPMTSGGQWDAGHFLSRGSHPELAFDEDNCHKQCKACNAGGGKFKHKERTVTEKYEAELIRRRGQATVDRLRGPNPIVKRTAAQWMEVEATYRAKLKALQSTRKEEA